MCNWVQNKDTWLPTKCYAAWDEDQQKWVKGCGYDECPVPYKNSVEKYINEEIKPTLPTIELFEK
jgi:hypothetical protein